MPTAGRPRAPFSASLLPGAFVLLGALLLVAACGGDDEPPAGNGADAPEATQPPSAPGSTPAAATGPLPELRLQRVYPSLSFEKMTGLFQAPDGRVFVLEQPGRIRLFEDRADASQASVFLNIEDRVDDGSSEMGLLGFAFAPDFAQSGTFYVNYTAGNPRRTVVSRFTSSGNTANPSSEQIILELGQPFANHNGGQLAFGPDGYLYIAFGDGGSQRDPQGNGQNLNTLLGKILRIDVNGRSADRAYAIPSDNPFVGRGGGVREEIWAYGFRNPWRFSFDRQSGALWAGDVGQNAWEEIDLVVKGANYGWNVMEGSHCLSGSSCNRDGLTLPVIDYARSGNRCSVTGGFAYRGDEIDALQGAYVYADYCSGDIWAFRYNGSAVTDDGTLVDGQFPISSFAQRNDGELLILNYGSPGGIYQLVD